MFQPSANRFYRVLELQARYLSTVSRVTSEFWLDLAEAFSEAGMDRLTREGRPIDMRGRSSLGTHYRAPTSEQAIILLDAEAGHTAVGVFAVDNYLDHPISGRVTASPFIEPTDTEYAPRLTFEPGVVNLAPGEQALVRVTAFIDDTLPPGVSHRCELSIPDLARTTIPVVVRRRAATVGTPQARINVSN
ncbi:MAG: hypothetical protein JO166_09120 [Deltaproteobacteria bacterium]|nr:hypothetical protein [Deltaproteobacteria bacterium]